MHRFLAALALVVLTIRPALADPTSDVRNAMIGLLKATSYHVNLTSAEGKLVDGDVVNPGKMHLTVGPVEIIKIDTTTYVKIAGTWRQFTLPGIDRFMGPLASAQSLAKNADQAQVTDLGPKTVDGAALHAYLVKSSADTHAVTVYLDAQGEVTRIEAPETSGTAVVRFSNYNAPVTIEAPV